MNKTASLINRSIINLFVIVLFSFLHIVAQGQNTTRSSSSSDTLSKFDKFNQKGEALFKVLPFPMVSYSTETGSVFGLAKYNMVNLVKGDTISASSSFSELVSFSSLGQIKVVLGTSLYMGDNKYIFKGGVNYISYPEYILGVGNNVTRETVEKVVTERVAFNNAFLVALDDEKHIYVGIIQDYMNYLNVETDTNSFLTNNLYPGYQGGISSGFGLGAIYDTRDHKYNATKGLYLGAQFEVFDNITGSDFNYTSYQLEARKFFNPWYKHVVGLQLFTQYNAGTVPFYSLSLLGGTNRMRGYYLGAIRDKAIMDAQVEYRMHVWSIFGVVAFASAGRVADNFGDMNLNGLWYAGGFGLRIMVDSENKANLRIDFGYGQQNSKTLAFGFAEAF